jgi:hypothetical protein
MKRTQFCLVPLLALLLSLCACAPSGQGRFAVLPTLGYLYVDTSGYQHYVATPAELQYLPVVFLADTNSPILADLSDNILSVQVNHDDQIPVSFLSGPISKAYRGVVQGILYLSITFPEQEADTLTITSMQVTTASNVYDLPLGSITLCSGYMGNTSELSLFSTLAASSATGLDRYQVNFHNTTDHPIYLTDIEFGPFADFALDLRSGPLADDSSSQPYPILDTSNGLHDLQVPLQPGETTYLVLEFPEAPEDYAVFLMSPLLTLQTQGETFHAFVNQQHHGIIPDYGDWASLLERFAS